MIAPHVDSVCMRATCYHELFHVFGRDVVTGPWLDGASLYQLMEDYRVTVSLGVPTVWLGLLNFMDQNRLRFTTFKMAVREVTLAPAQSARVWV